MARRTEHRNQPGSKPWTLGAISVCLATQIREQTIDNLKNDDSLL